MPANVLTQRISDEEDDRLPVEQATFLGERSRTADRNALMQAKKLHQQGAPREQIWQETGWFRRSNGKWNYEADDRQFKELKAPANGRFFDSYDHPQVETAYPGMAQSLRLRRYSPTAGEGGEFSPGRGVGIVHNPGPAYGPEPTRVIALHELQHALDAEDGTHPTNIPELFEAESRAYAVMSPRLNMTPEQRRARPPWLDTDAMRQSLRAGNDRRVTPAPAPRPAPPAPLPRPTERRPRREPIFYPDGWY